ncbi:MAG TPA: tetraacyldisaccharide 4'-kinase [Thermodesulfovibrionales bacterium]|nr:tetraacyldisaccharide 4'-kinase [Thermodesulfovibrionales bacterium]
MGPLEYIYYLGYSFKKSLDVKKEKRLPKRVVSVGNMTVGGTGKTPAVIAIAERARGYGYRPCILTRGYGGKAKGPCFVSRGDGALIGVDEAGDEPVLLAERLRGIPVVKGKDRFAAGMFALQSLNPEPELFILDDGFQHRKLYRDRNILLVDSTNPFGNGKLLPLGRLREPLSEMKRADIIVITKTSHTFHKVSGLSPDGMPCVSLPPSPSAEETTRSLLSEIKRYSPSATVFLSGSIPTGLKNLSGSVFPPHLLSGKRVFGFCGIGNPDSFRKTLMSVEADVRDMAVFRDHIRYSGRHIRKIWQDARKCRADWIVTTEKDIMKLTGLSLPDELRESLVSLGIEFVIDNDFFEKTFREE